MLSSARKQTRFGSKKSLGTIALSAAVLASGALACDLPSLVPPDEKSQEPRARVGKALPPPPTEPLAPFRHASSTIVLGEANGRTLAYVADADGEAILTVDLDSGQLLETSAVGGRPSSLLLAPGGALFVTVADRNEVQRFQARGLSKPLRHVATAQVPSEPLSLASSEDGELFAVSGWGRSITEFDVTDGLSAKRSVPVAPEPRSAIVRAGKVYVSHARGGVVSVVQGEEVRLLDAMHNERAPRVHRQMRRPPMLHLHHEPIIFHKGGPAPSPEPAATEPVTLQPLTRVARPGTTMREAVHAHSWIALDDRLVSPTVWVHSGPARVTSGYGSTEVPVLKEGLIVVNPLAGEGDEELTTAAGLASRRSQEGHQFCTVPRVAARTASDRFVVACDGINALVEYGFEGGRLIRHQGVDTGAGVTGLAYDAEKDRVVSWSQFDRELSTVSLKAAEPSEARGRETPWNESEPVVREIGSDPLPALVARGRRLFHDSGTRISQDGRSCISCHPGGRQDGLVWSGPTGPRQTPMLLGRFGDTEPFGWNGASETLRVHLDETIQRLGGSGLEDGDAEAIIAYFTSAAGPVHSEADAEVARGQELFESEQTGCSDCHRANHNFVNGAQHSILSSAPVDTPSLRYVGGTGPYMHDGRYATLEEVLAETDGIMGHTSQLNQTDRSALLSYLRTL